jgi:dynein heavy chain, axonemal
MSAAATEMQKYQSYFDRYKPLWEMDKEAIIRKYQKTKRTLQQLEGEILRYKKEQAEIEKEDGTYSAMFIKVDCTLIKKALVEHCVQWQQKLTGLLNQQALSELKALHLLFQSNTRKLQVRPLCRGKDKDMMTMVTMTLILSQKQSISR